MPWQLTILLQNVFASVYAIESRALAKKYKDAHFQILASVFAMLYIVFLVYAILNIHEISFAIPVLQLVILMLVASAFTIWTVLTFITLRYVDASIGTMLSALNLVAVIIVAAGMLGERLSLMQFAGAVILLLAVYIVYKSRQSKAKHRNLLWAITLSAIASTAFGLAITGEKYLLDNLGAPTYAVVGIGAQFGFLLVLAVLYKPRQFRQLKNTKFRNKVLVMGLVRGGAGLLFILSVVGAGNVALVSMLSGLKIVLTTILGAILLKELTFIKRKAVASAFACVAVAMMLW